MPEAGQTPQKHQAVAPRRRRSGFRRHRTCLRFLKCCAQSACVRVRHPEIPEAALVRTDFAERDGYPLIDARDRRRSAARDAMARGARPSHRTSRRGSVWRHRCSPLFGGAWHLYLVPQNIAHSLAAPIKRTFPPGNAAAASISAVAAPRTRSGHPAPRALRRFRPNATRLLAARTWRR